MKCLQNKSILLVDDDPGMLRALDKLLRSEGAVATCVDWAGDAVQILTARKAHFDLVITDLRMPMITGATLLDSIHKIFPTLPVIVLTAFGAPGLVTVCRKLGAMAVLEKPVDSGPLLAAIQNALGTSEAN